MLIHKIDKVHREQREKTNLSRITPKKPKTYFYQSKNKNQGRNMLKDNSISLHQLNYPCYEHAQNLPQNAKQSGVVFTKSPERSSI